MNLIMGNRKNKIIKFLYIISFLLLDLGCSTLENRIEKNRIDFYIGINSCFEGDNLIVKIKDIEVFNANNVTSDIDSGSTGIYLEYYENSKREGILVINNLHHRQKKEIFLNFKKDLTLKIIRNGHLEKFNLDLKQGNRILVNGCDEEMKTTSIRYYKKRIIVD